MQKLLIVLLCFASTASAQSLQERMLLAEDARLATEAGLAPLVEAVKSGPRRTAIRAIGRLERPELIALVAPSLNDGVGIRAEAANALAQLARTPEAVALVQKLLIDRAAVDASLNTWESWGEIAAALGRLPYGTPSSVAEAEAVLIQGLPSPDSLNDTDAAAIIGSTRGLESLARTVRARKLPPLGARTWDLLRWAATAQRPAADPRSAMTRRLAMAALVTGNQATASVIDRGLLDADAEVRRFAAAAAAGDAAIADRDTLLKRAMSDKDAHVRLEGLRGWGRFSQKTSCAPVRAALKDPDPHMRLQAIDQLGAGCPLDDKPEGLSPHVRELSALVETLSTQPRMWHMPAHALVSLARQSPDESRKALPRFVQHPTWQVRMYAARAAGVLNAVDTLGTLGRDSHDNVREAALTALVELKQPEAVTVALDALTRPDYQLILTAARALDDKAIASKTAAPLVAALARITKDRKDTSRDPRIAILNRLQALGATSEAASLEGYLRDFDPLVAAKAAEILTTWTGKARTASPQPLPAPGVTLAAVNALRGKSLRFHMAAGGSFDIGLDVDAAPLTSWRIARHAGEGYYNGLTFHRVVPNFVIQGGSPGANEYAGEPFYMRDEPGLHVRGTVGISTRGRDTGDAQIFVNLIDSPRLDHIYTVLGTVVAGMDIVDGVLEGDVIQRVELVSR